MKEAAAAAAKDRMQSLPAVTFSSKLFVRKKRKEKQKNLICFSSKRKSQVADSPGLWALAPYCTSHECCFVALEEKKKEKSKWILASFCQQRKGRGKFLTHKRAAHPVSVCQTVSVCTIYIVLVATPGGQRGNCKLFSAALLRVTGGWATSSCNVLCSLPTV